MEDTYWPLDQRKTMLEDNIRQKEAEIFAADLDITAWSKVKAKSQTLGVAGAHQDANRRDADQQIDSAKVRKMRAETFIELQREALAEVEAALAAQPKSEEETDATGTSTDGA